VSATDRKVRSAVLELLIDGSARPNPSQIAEMIGLSVAAAADSLPRLAGERRLVLSEDGDSVAMAHPFSAFPTDYRSWIGERTWWANCAWDAFAILALLGDGSVVITSSDRSEAVWTVDAGVVAPEGFVHFVVPPRRFWDDIGFT